MFLSVSFNGLEKAINSTISGLWLKSFEGQSNAARLQSWKLFFSRCLYNWEGFNGHVQSVRFSLPFQPEHRRHSTSTLQHFSPISCFRQFTMSYRRGLFPADQLHKTNGASCVRGEESLLHHHVQLEISFSPCFDAKRKIGRKRNAS